MGRMLLSTPGQQILGLAQRHLRYGGKGCFQGCRTLPSSIRSATTSAARAEGVLETQADSNVSRHIPSQDRISGGRKAAIKNAKPFSDFLTDTFNRQHDYLRISLTERCNLRCLYCMPEEGVQLSPPAELLTTPEIHYLSALFVSQGVTKIRLTGGEPTIRRDILPLMHQIGSLRSKGLRELAITTNGISLHRKLDSMAEAGLTGVNLSLDTLDPFQFQIMTRRKGFDAVMKSIEKILEMNKMGAGIRLKVNCVVMRGLNDREIIPFVELGREKDVEVRFIEYMPFDGNKWSEGKMLPYQDMLDIIREKYPGLEKVQDHKNDTSKTFQVPGFVGKVGFITSMTHNFCGTCNRLRITSDGNLKVCLFGNAEVSLRDLLRQGNNGLPIDEEAFESLKQLELDRHEGRVSSDTPLGWGEREQDLLKVIGAAVKRKEAGHAGMDQLQNMKNRPMILIDPANPLQPFKMRTPSSISRSNATSSSGLAWSHTPLHLLPRLPQGSSLEWRASMSTSTLRATTVTSERQYSSFAESQSDQRSTQSAGDHAAPPRIMLLNTKSRVYSLVPDRTTLTALKLKLEEKVQKKFEPGQIFIYDTINELFYSISETRTPVAYEQLYDRLKKKSFDYHKRSKDEIHSSKGLHESVVENLIHKQDLLAPKAAIGFKAIPIQELEDQRNAEYAQRALDKAQSRAQKEGPGHNFDALRSGIQEGARVEPGDQLSEHADDSGYRIVRPSSPALEFNTESFDKNVKRKFTHPDRPPSDIQSKPSFLKDPAIKALREAAAVEAQKASQYHAHLSRAVPGNGFARVVLGNQHTSRLGSKPGEPFARLSGLSLRSASQDSLPAPPPVPQKKDYITVRPSWLVNVPAGPGSLKRRLRKVARKQGQFGAATESPRAETLGTSLSSAGFGAAVRRRQQLNQVEDTEEAVQSSQHPEPQEQLAEQPQDSATKEKDEKLWQTQQLYSQLLLEQSPLYKARKNSNTKNARAYSTKSGSTRASETSPPETSPSETSPLPLNHTAGPAVTQKAPEVDNTSPVAQQQNDVASEPHLTHLNSAGSAHMVSVTSKPSTARRAIAIGRVTFSNPDPADLIARNAVKKGDVLSIARIAGITAAKKCPEIIPLCHPITLGSVTVDVDLVPATPNARRTSYGEVQVTATVECYGPTGVEMEALTAVWGATATVYDMCKAVDKGMAIMDVRVVLKEGGRSGTMMDPNWVPTSGIAKTIAEKTVQSATGSPPRGPTSGFISTARPPPAGAAPKKPTFVGSSKNKGPDSTAVTFVVPAVFMILILLAAMEFRRSRAATAAAKKEVKREPLVWKGMDKGGQKPKDI